MKKIVLILCPPFWTKLPPLGIAYLAESVQAHGCKPMVYDLNICAYHHASPEMKKQWLNTRAVNFQDTLFLQFQREYPDFIQTSIERILNEDPFIIGFSVFRSNHAWSIACAQEIRKHTKAPILFGGPEVLVHQLAGCSIFPPAIYESINGMIAGEGEQGLLEVITQYETTGQIPLFTETKEYPNLDTIPFPRYTHFDIGLYERKRALPILASRGCVRQCTFCRERLLSKRFRRRSVENIIEEILWHKKHNNTVWFTFHDSLINADLKTLECLCAEMIRLDLDIRWEAQVAIRSDMSVDLIKQMKEAGCFNIFIGLESGSDTVLARMKKGYTSQEGALFLRRCSAADMHCEVSLIVGFPGETEHEFEETQEFLLKNKKYIPKIAQVNPFVRLEGTPASAMNGGGETPREGRVSRLIHFLEDHDFIYTPAFVNNLVEKV